MSYLQEHIALTDWFKTQWSSLTPVQWENTDLRPPRNAQGEPDPYVVFTIQNGPSEQIEFGKPTNNYRHNGMVIVQVLVPEDKGTDVVLGLADAVAGIYRSKQFTAPNIVLKSPQVGRVGRNSGYYQLNVVIQYHRDDTF